MGLRGGLFVRAMELPSFPWFPLGGKVAGEVLNQIAQAWRASPTQVALAWLPRRSTMLLPIPGTHDEWVSHFLKTPKGRFHMSTALCLWLTSFVQPAQEFRIQSST